MECKFEVGECDFEFLRNYVIVVVDVMAVNVNEIVIIYLSIQKDWIGEVEMQFIFQVVI